MRRPRHLSHEERALWDLVAGRAKPLDPKKKPVRPTITPKPRPVAVPVKEPTLLPMFRVGQTAKTHRSHDVAAPIADQLAAAPLNMDAKSFGKMKRGKIVPEARIDLHGLTLSEAHSELLAFILTTHANGLRLVLVITGKGKERDEGGPIPTRYGVLRHQVPQWLALPPLRQSVLQVSPAHLKHGGQGAYYVYLRRSR